MTRTSSPTPDRAETQRSPTFGLWIRGGWRPALSEETFERVNPYDGTVAGTFSNGDQRDADDAIAAAADAFVSGIWSLKPARVRSQVLLRMAQLIDARAREIADRMVFESGKPLSVALGEIGAAVRSFEYYSGLVLDLEGSAISDRRPDALGLVLHEPVGVAGLITPWNFPILNPVNKIAPALAAGCTVVIKPSHLCSGPTLLLAQYLSEAGLPDGVMNVVTSDLERGAVVGQAIAASPQVDKIAFTGSTTTGRAVMQTAASTIKRVSLELGGKSANIVFADAPLSEAAETSVNACCYNSGQQCSAATRLLVQREIHDQFVEDLVARSSKQVLGDPSKPETTMGPIVNEEQFARVMSYIDLGRQEGTLLVGGGRPGGQEFENSKFVSPTIFDEVDNSSRLAQEEIFGPVLTIVPFATEDDAIRIANDSPYGLAGGVWSRSIDRALRVVKAVRTGKMFVNSYNNVGLDDLPHGGYKESGVGREQGRYGLAEYQEIKTVQIKLSSTGTLRPEPDGS